jgi:hypothetical protein
MYTVLLPARLIKKKNRLSTAANKLTYLLSTDDSNAAGPVPLVLDLRIAHDRFGSSSDPDLNEKLHWPNDMDKPLNEAAAGKIRKYRADYNHSNNPNSISFIPAMTSTSGRLHSEFIRILFLQTHRETDRFFATSGVQSA